MTGRRLHALAMRHAIAQADCQIPYALHTGTRLDNMEADLHGPSHGYDWRGQEGNIVKLAVGELQTLIALLYSQTPPPVGTAIVEGGYLVPKEFIQDAIDLHARRLCHYIVDSLTIGQVCGPEFRGRKDDIIDLACEWVRDKARDVDYYKAVSRPHNIEDFEEDMLNSIRWTYKQYRPDAVRWFRRRWWFWPLPTPWNVTHMARRAVGLGSAMAAGAFVLAGKTATKTRRQE